jgi:hypothetical protein
VIPEGEGGVKMGDRKVILRRCESYEVASLEKII